MSDIVLSASVRQNLLSLQSTADLLATTQNRLATGKKVNTALDNPTNFFTAEALDNRASDINNLLDGIGNGVQVLQAANTGITSLQKLVDSAKSVAHQALQAAVGYSSKSSVTTTAITGATADDLRGTVGGGDGRVPSRPLTAACATRQHRVQRGHITGAHQAVGTTKLSVGQQRSRAITVRLTRSRRRQDDPFYHFGHLWRDRANSLLDLRLNVSSLLGAIDCNQRRFGFRVTSGAITLHTGTASGPRLDRTSSNTAASPRWVQPAVSRRLRTPLGGQTADNRGDRQWYRDQHHLRCRPRSGEVVNDLNVQLAGNNLQATLTSDGKITITTTNDAASATIGTIGGTAAGAGNAFNGLVGAAPVVDVSAQTIRSNLVTQYNNILDQITTTAQDASYNGINLLNGDQLKLTFNETGKSTLTFQGVQFNSAGLGLSKLNVGHRLPG